MLYSLFDFGHFLMAPVRAAAGVTQATFQNPYSPLSFTSMGRTIAAGAELLERTTRRYAKPEWQLPYVEANGAKLPLNVECVLEKPFCRLLHFVRAGAESLPKVLIVAPMSGHHATLLRGTVEAMLPAHDVYITDWTDARLVPMASGSFDLEDYISYVMEFCRHLGAATHVMAICQPAVPVFCAVALLAQMNDPAQPRSMILMGGPIDTRAAPTSVTKLAEKHSLGWFERSVVSTVPVYYPGALRRVYPGFMQLSSFISMHPDKHMGEHMRHFQHLVQGDGESATTHRKFYDEYLAVMDITAEFYLQTVERVFQKQDLPRGTFRWKDMTVNAAAITKTALFTIEGELDDISAPGQTLAAQAMCSELSEDKKRHLFAKQVGHYGIFNGRKWRTEVQPQVQAFIAQHDDAAASGLRVVASR